MQAFQISLPFELDPGEIVDVIADLARSGGLGMRTISPSIVDPRLRFWLANIGVGLRHAEVFYTPPGAKSPIHIDAPDGRAAHAKMNFAYGGPGSVMRWYEAIDSASSRSAITPTGTRSQILQEGGGRMIYTAEIGRPSLINAGIYHDVINPSDEPRWCLSLVMQYDGGRMGWEIAKKVFAFCAKDAI